MAEQIFLSYRRKDGSDKARLLKTFLTECGYTVFMDTEKKDNGPFPEYLRKKVRECMDFILIVTEDTSNIRVEEDWVLEEMKTAFDTQTMNAREGAKCPNLHVFTANLDYVKMFKKKEVPDKYKETHEYFGILTGQEVLNFEDKSDRQIVAMFKEMNFYARSQKKHAHGGVQTMYIASEKEELARLKRQGATSYHYDKKYLDAIVERLQARKGFSGKLSVLDVGCANGETGRQYFANDDVFGTVLGIDYKDELIEEAEKRVESGIVPERFMYRKLNLSSDTFAADFNGLCRMNRIGKFDIIFCCQVLHHVAKRERVLKALKNQLADGGCLIIRGSDDGCKLFYSNHSEGNDEQLLRQIIDLTTTIPTMADRFYGRKIYFDLLRAQLSDVRVLPITVATSMETGEDRNKLRRRFYSTSFSWRENIFQPRPTDSPEKRRELEPYNKEMEDCLEELKERFLNGGSWYMETDFFGYGFKEGEDDY